MSVPARYPVELGFLRVVQRLTAETVPANRLTQYSLILPRVKQISAFVNYSELVHGPNPSRNLNTLLTMSLKGAGLITVHDQVQISANRRTGFEWTRELKGGGILRLGFDRAATGRDAGYFPVAGIQFKLPDGHRMEVSYASDRTSRMVQVRLGHTVTRKRATSGISDVVAGLPATVAGKVYDDRNFNGRFDKDIDRPIPGVSVRLDDERETETDSTGNYKFASVTPGAHAMRAELESVPARFTFAEPPSRALMVYPQREGKQDFRIVQTGQIAGNVTYLNSQGLPDVRVIAAKANETFTELAGMFLLSDLPPGKYELKLDPATLPAGSISQPETISLEINPGDFIRNISFVVGPSPATVIEKVLPPQVLKKGGK